MTELDCPEPSTRYVIVTCRFDSLSTVVAMPPMTAMHPARPRKTTIRILPNTQGHTWLLGGGLS
ncbi:hypothetical protein [Mycolicibacterium thermoresistibile]